MFSVNDVLTVGQNRTTCFVGVVRVVAVTKDGYVALIQLDTQSIHAPFIRKAEDLVQGLGDGSIIRLQKFDANIFASIDHLSEPKRKLVERIKVVMEPLLGDDDLIIDAEYRGKVFEQRAIALNINKRTIRRYFYSYLWGGMTETAFIAPKKLFDKPRKQAPNTARRGPKPTNPEIASHVTLPEVRDKLEEGVKIFWHPGKHTQLEAYILTQKKFFSSGKKLLHSTDGLASLEDILLPKNKMPSYNQFRYVCKLLAPTLAQKPDKNHRNKNTKKFVQRGRARHGVAGPGYRFEIDATRVQVRIVSRYARRKLLKEATLYIVIDIWSGAIVGYALSLENASWALASKALKNCFTDKSVVFERLNLPYTSADWPSRHLPSRLAADRAELVSNKAGVLPEIGIKVEIMPSMCPERKGKVESQFNAVKHLDNFYKMPGKHKKSPGRRENDGTKDAALTLSELERIIVEIIIDLNNDPVPINQIPPEAIQSGRSAITHGGLFEWGLRHRAGFTRSLTPVDVFTNLLSKGIGSVTPEGIHFKKQNYYCDALTTLGLQGRAIKNGAFDIDIRYDEHFADEIWFFNDHTREWIVAVNDNEDVKRLKASFWEVEEFLQEASKLAYEAKSENIHRKSEKSKRLNKMTNQAISQATIERKGMPKKQAKSDIRDHTAIDKEAERIIQSQAAAASYTSAIQKERQEIDNNSAPAHLEDEPLNSNTSIGKRSLELWRKKTNANLGQ